MKSSIFLAGLLAPALPVFAAEAPAPAVSPVKEIIVVIKTHFDIGYTHRVKDVIPYYRTAMIDKALGAMDASLSLPAERQFSWTGPGWVMAKVLEDWPGQTPERRKRLDEAVKSGKFRFHALPFSLESDACEPEEMARGFIFASAISRKYGLPLPIAGKMSDVPSHGGALETVLANGGVKFMHSGGNWPSGFVQTPGIFWWEGPDGSRTLTFQSGIYGTATGFNWPDNWRFDGYVGTHFVPPANWPYKVWPAIMVTMDNSGPPKPETVKSYFDEAQKKCPGAKIRMGTMDDFARAFIAENPKLPVVKGEMPDTWIHGVMSDPGGSKLSREVHPLIASAEALHTQLGLWGTTLPPVASEVAEAYENILLYGEHTWGMAPSVRTFGDALAKADPKLVATLEASWEDKTDYIRKADKIARTIADTNLNALAKSVKADAGSVIVYNPLPWPRSGLVEAGGQKLTVTDVPPCGYKTVPVTPATAPTPAARDTIENKFYRITFDPVGGRIASLVDKRTGRDWVDASADRGLGAYLNERFTFEQTLAYTTKYQMGRGGAHPGMHKPGMVSEKTVPYRAVVSSNGTLAVTADAVSQTAVLSCPADPANHKPATELRVTLPVNGPYIELEMTIKDKAKDNWPEADWFCLPFKVESPKFRVYRQLGAIDPATDILPGANRDLLSVGHGVTISGPDGAGIAISPLDHPLVSLDRPGIWKFSKDAAEFTPKKPIVYLNLYNNQWNTNFRYWYPGSWSSRVRLTTFDAKTAPEAVIATPALEARNPLLATVAQAGSTGTLPAGQSGLSVSRKGTIVTAFGTNPDGPGTLLRVWEMAGISGDLTVTLPAGSKFTKARPVNLRGEKAGAPLEITNNKIVFPLHAYAPASFVLE